MSEQMNIGTLVGYLTLDDSGVDKGTRSATQKIQGFARTGSAEGAKAGTAIGNATGQSTVTAFGKSEGPLTSKVSSMFGSVAKIGAGILGGMGVAQILTKGWDRLTGIENAQAKLKGLGHDAADVQTIMDNALAAVKGTAFGLGDAATIAANAVAANIQPGQDLERTLRLIADSAAIANTDLGTMGSVFNKVAANGRLTGDTLQQLQDQGIPVLQFLSKQLGVTAADVTKMVSQGQIDFKTFEDAMEKGVGGSALAMGDTTTGALMNMGAAAGRFGATLLQDVQPMVKSFAGVAIDAFDTAGQAASGLISTITGLPGPVKAVGVALGASALANAFGVFDRIEGAASKLGGTLGGLSGIWGRIGDDAAMAGVSRLTAGLNVARSAAVSAGSAVMDVFGGPWGVAVVGATVLVNAYAKAWGDAKPPIEDINQIIDENTGKLKDNTDAIVVKAFADYLDVLRKAGVEQGQLADAVEHGGKAYDDLISRLKDYKTKAYAAQQASPLASLIGVGGAQKNLNDVNGLLDALAVQRDKVTDAEKRGAAVADELNTKTRDAILNTKGYTDATDDARSSAVKTAETWAAMAFATTDLARAQDDARTQAVNLRQSWDDLANQPAVAAIAQLTASKVADTAAAMADANTKAHDLSGALSDVSDALDRMAGRTPDTEQALRDFNGAMSDLADQVGKKGKGALGSFSSSLIDANGVIDTSTEKGQKLYDSVTKMAQAARDAALDQASLAGATGGTSAAAQAAAHTLAAQRQAFIDNAKQMGLTKTMAEKLATAYFGLPKNISTVVTGRADFSDVDAKIQALADNTVYVNVKGKLVGTTGNLNAGPRAAGGAIVGGPKGVDTHLALLAGGEHVFTAGDVDAMGGQSNVYAFRRSLHGGLLGMAAGGAIEGPTSQQLSGLPAVTVGPILTAVQSALAAFADTVEQTADALTDANSKAKDARDTVAQLTASYRESVASGREALKSTVERENQALATARERLADAQKRQAQAKAGSKESASAAAAVEKAQKAVTAAEAARVAAINKTTAANQKANAADLAKLNTAKAAAAQANSEAAAAKARAGAIAALQQQSQFLQRTQERLAGQLDDTNQALDAATASLSNLQQQSQQLRDSVAGKITGDASITGLNPGSTVQNIIDYLSGQAQSSSALSGSLSALASKGLNGTILQDLAGMGLSGGPLAATLAGASAAQLSQINSLQAQIAAASDKAGKSVADAIYANDIRIYQQQVNDLDARQADLEAALQKNADALSASIQQALTLQTQALDPAQTVAQLKTIAADNAALPTRIVTALRKAS